MATVFDVASFIERELPVASGDEMKLHKLLYYSQAWSLVWDGVPLFEAPLEAWRGGPVSPHVYGERRYERPSGNPEALDSNARTTVLAVLAGYGNRPGTWLSELTHRERPWIDARQGLPPEVRSKNVIATAAMKAWYASHRWGEGKSFSAAYLRGLELMVETPEEEVELLADLEGVPAESYLSWLEHGDASCPEN